MALSKEEAQVTSTDEFIRNSIINSVYMHYNNLISYLRKIPIDQNVFQHAYFHFQDGILNIKEMISRCPIVDRNQTQNIQNHANHAHTEIKENNEPETIETKDEVIPESQL